MLTGAGAGAALGLLASLAWLGLSSGETEPDVPETERLIALAERRSAVDAGGIPDAVKWLRQALELEPGNQEAIAGLERAKSDAVEAVRNELEAGRAIVARELLDLFNAEWSRDSELSDLRTDTAELFDELARGAELAGILERARVDVAEMRLRAPEEENAWDKLGQAEALIAASDQGRRNWIEAHRHRIAGAYVSLIDEAIAQGSVSRARRHVENLEATAADHPDGPRLRQQLKRLVEARTAQAAAEAATDSASQSAAGLAREQFGNRRHPSPTGASTPVSGSAPGDSGLFDEEDEFWAKVKRQYEARTRDCAVLRRYNEAYPGGRFEDEYFTLKAQCDRRGNL